MNDFCNWQGKVTLADVVLHNNADGGRMPRACGQSAGMVLYCTICTRIWPPWRLRLRRRVIYVLGELAQPVRLAAAAADRVAWPTACYLFMRNSFVQFCRGWFSRVAGVPRFLPTAPIILFAISVEQRYLRLGESDIWQGLTEIQQYLSSDESLNEPPGASRPFSEV